MSGPVATPETAYVVAFRDGLAEAMERDPDIFVAGEDVGEFGGVWRSYMGLHARFGGKRVFDTPISEQAIIGLATGAAVSGLRPVVDIMFFDFFAVCLDQIANQAAKMKYMFGGKARLPMTIVTWGGAGLSGAAQHSQSLEAWLCHIPGLKVVMPSTPEDAKGLIAASVFDDNPVVYIGNKKLLGLTGPVPEGYHEVPLGSARTFREGDSVTIVAMGAMVHEAIIAAEELARDGIEAEIIDPRTLEPLDLPTIVTSVKKTNRVVVVHEAVQSCGFGAEIAARINESAFDWLDAPVKRVGAPFSPVPMSPDLEKFYVPNAERIAEAARATLQRTVA